MNEQNWPGPGPQPGNPHGQGPHQPPQQPPHQPPPGQGAYQPAQQGGFINQPGDDGGTQLGTPAWQQVTPGSPQPMGYGGGPGWQAPPPPRKSKLPVIIGAVVALALIAVAVTWWLLGRQQEHRADPPVASTTTPAATPSPSVEASASTEPSQEASPEPSPAESSATAAPSPSQTTEPSPDPSPTASASPAEPSATASSSELPVANPPFKVAKEQKLGEAVVRIPVGWTVQQAKGNPAIGESDVFVISNPKSSQLKFGFFEIVDLKKNGVDNAASLCAVYNKPLVKDMDPKTVEEQAALPLTFEGPIDVTVCGAKGVNKTDGLTYDYAWTTYVDKARNRGLVLLMRNNWKGYSEDNSVFTKWGDYYRCALGREMGVWLSTCKEG